MWLATNQECRRFILPQHLSLSTAKRIRRCTDGCIYASIFLNMRKTVLSVRGVGVKMP